MEGSTSFELGRCLCVPVAHRLYRTCEVDFIHLAWYTLVTWPIGVGSVPEETPFLDYHDRVLIGILRIWSVFDRYGKIVAIDL